MPHPDPTSDPAQPPTLSQIRSALNRKNIAEFSWTGIGQVGSILLGILTIKIITSTGPEAYGGFVLATSVTGMLSMAFFGPMEQGFVRHYFDFSRDPGRRFVFLSLLNKTLLVAFLGFLALGAVAVLIMDQQTEIGLSFLTAAGLMVVVTAASVPIAGMLNAFRLRREVALTQLGEKILTLGLLGGMVLAGAVTIPRVMACIALSAACWFFVRFKVYGKSAANGVSALVAQEERNDLVRAIVRQVTSYSIPFVGWGFISWIQMSGERWIMGGLLSTSDVGRYGLGAALIQSSAVVAFNVMAQYVTPIIYEKYSDPDLQIRQRGLRIIQLCGWVTMGIFAVSGLLFYFAGAEIIRLISNRDFLLEPELLLGLTIGVGLFYVGQMMTTAGLAAQQPRIYMVPKIIGAAFALGAYTIGCSVAGISGVVGAVIVTNGLYVGLIAWTNRSHQVMNIRGLS